MRAARLGRLDVLLCRVSDHLHAVENRCSQAATELANGRLRGNLLEYPLQGAEFDVRTGNRTQPPARRPIGIFAVRTENGPYPVGIPSDDRVVPRVSDRVDRHPEFVSGIGAGRPGARVGREASPDLLLDPSGIDRIVPRYGDRP